MSMIRILPRAASRFAAAAAVIFAAAACDPVRRTVDFDRAADFSDYATYVWVAEEAAPTAAGAPPLNPLVEQRVQDAIERALAAKGYAEGTPADFAVAYTVGVRERTYTTYLPDYEPLFVPGWGVRYVRTARRPVTRTYDEGTIAVDIFDLATGRPVWHGSATKEVDADDATPQAINEIVASLMADFPPQSAAPPAAAEPAATPLP